MWRVFEWVLVLVCVCVCVCVCVQAMLKRLMVVMESLESLERLLKIRRKPHLSSPASEEKSEIEELAERSTVKIAHYKAGI